MAFVVVYDTCALYGNTSRDLLIRVALAGMVQAKWSEDILDELVRVLGRRPGSSATVLERLRSRMTEAIPGGMVTGYKPLIEVIEVLDLPDPDDRHVLAAAIRSGAQLIVTDDLDDFPASVLNPYDLEAKKPDEFLVDLIDIDDRVVYSCVQQIVDSRNNPPVSIDDVLGQLERSGLVQAAGALRLGASDDC